MFFQPLTILSEGGRVEGLFTRLHIEKPAKQKVEVDLFAKLQLAANGVEGHQQQGFQQSLGRDASATRGAVGRFKPWIEGRQNAIYASLDVPQRMIRPDAILDLKSVKQW